MRHATSSIILFALYLLAAPASSAQNSTIDPCPVAESAFATPTNPKPTMSNHGSPILPLPQERDRLYFGDQALVLLCGSPQDAAQFFTEISGKAIRMEDAVVIEADKHSIRVRYPIGGRLSDAFRFQFESPVEHVPVIGSKVIISGTYSSYKRDDSLINMTNSHVALVPRPVR